MAEEKGDMNSETGKTISGSFLIYLFPASRAPPSKATESQCASQLSGLLHICPSLPTPEVSHVLRIKYLSPLEFLLQIFCVCGCLGSMYVCGSQNRVLDPCNMDASCHAVAGD